MQIELRHKKDHPELNFPRDLNCIVVVTHNGLEYQICVNDIPQNIAAALRCIAAHIEKIEDGLKIQLPGFHDGA